MIVRIPVDRKLLLRNSFFGSVHPQNTSAKKETQKTHLTDQYMRNPKWWAVKLQLLETRKVKFIETITFGFVFLELSERSRPVLQSWKMAEESVNAAWRAGDLAKAVDGVWQLLLAGLGPGMSGATGPVLAKKMPWLVEPDGAGTPPAKRQTQARPGREAVDVDLLREACKEECLEPRVLNNKLSGSTSSLAHGAPTQCPPTGARETHTIAKRAGGPGQSAPPAGNRAVMPTSPARVGGGCSWEAGRTPRDCLTENHMVLLRSLEGEERREAVRRIKRSRQAFLHVDNSISERLPSLERAGSFSSRDSASIAEKATSPKSVRMLRRSSWSGPSGSAAVCGGQGLVCVSQWLPHRRQWLRERSHGSENPEPGEVWGSEYEGKIADQTPRPSQPQGDPVLSPMFRLLGLTPRFSSSLAEQIRKDTGFTPALTGRREIRARHGIYKSYIE